MIIEKSISLFLFAKNKMKREEIQHRNIHFYIREYKKKIRKEKEKIERKNIHVMYKRI